MNKKIIMTTTHSIPGYEHEIIDVVVGNSLFWFKAKKASSRALKKLENNALILGADAIIGILSDTTVSGSQCYIGTAVKLTKIN